MCDGLAELTSVIQTPPDSDINYVEDTLQTDNNETYETGTRLLEVLLIVSKVRPRAQSIKLKRKPNWVFYLKITSFNNEIHSPVRDSFEIPISQESQQLNLVLLEAQWWFQWVGT